MKIDLGQLLFIHPKIRHILTNLEKRLGVEFTGTSIFRIDDPGVHGTLPTRGFDLRCKDAKFGKFLEDYVNDYYIYDPQRPDKTVCWFHEVDGKGLHLHFQVHPNTVRRYK